MFQIVLKNTQRCFPMIVFLSILAKVIAYNAYNPGHMLVISARNSPYHSHTFPFAQIGPYKTSTDPILFAKAFRYGEALSNKEKEFQKEESDESVPVRKPSNFTSRSKMYKFFFYPVIAILIFFIGYQTGKFRENCSYVRLPTTN